MSKFLPPGLGWHRDLPDVRDYTPTHPEIQALLQPLKRPRGSRSARPARIDLREYCPSIENQQPLHSSTAHACLALLQYFERRAIGKITEPSRLFLYKMARQLLHWTGDTGAPIRTTLKAMVRFGIPPEELWPYEPAKLDQQPDPFLFSYASGLETIRYVRLDPRGAAGQESLDTLKSFLAAGFACVLGFPVFASLSQEPDIPFPTVFDPLRGGQAVVAVGYDDTRAIRSTRGALLIRNSWGESWGDAGYGWLPEAYVKEQVAGDIWTLVKAEWMATGEFDPPTFARGPLGRM